MTEKREINNLKDKENGKSDFSSLNKYFIDDSLIKKTEPVRVKTITEDISINEVSLSSFESEEEIGTPEIHQNIEKKGCPNKIKFLKHLSDESLTLDTCNNINKDWNNKNNLRTLNH